MTREEIIQMASMLGSRWQDCGETDIMLSCPAAPFAHAGGTDHRQSFGVQISHKGPSKCHCFTCQFGGNSLSTAFSRLQTVPDPVIEFVQKAESLNIRALLDRRGMTTRKTRKKVYDIETLVYSTMRDRKGDEYLLSRGLTRAEIDRYWLGYDNVTQRVTFPTRTRTEVVGCTGRSIAGAKNKYYKYPGSSGAILFGENFLDINRQEIILVEGPFDAIKASRALPNVLCLMGVSLTNKQLQRLLHFAEVVNIMLDGNEAGVLAEAKLGERLAQKVRVFVIETPEGKEPDDLTPREMHQLYRARKVFF